MDSHYTDFFVCPKCHHKLQKISSSDQLVCTSCNLAYPIIDTIPVLLLEEARRYRPEEK